MSSIRGTTTKLWPRRRFSAASACRTRPGSNGASTVCTGRRRAGGVSSTLSACSPRIAPCNVRGIGVALSVSTCTPSAKPRSLSLMPVPKRCSSSMISRPSRSKRDALAGDRVRADHDIDRPVGQPLLDLARLGRRDEPRQPGDLRAERREAAAESVEVLPHQHRRRRDQRDLTAAEHRSRGGAQRHLGLAEPDIAADQPVHRMPRFQVGQDVRDGARLIDRRHEREPGDEALVAPGRRVQLRRLPGLALARQAQQAPRGLGDVVLRPARGAFSSPRRRAGRATPPRSPRRIARPARSRRPAPSARRRRHTRCAAPPVPRCRSPRRSRCRAAFRCRARYGSPRRRSAARFPSPLRARRASAPSASGGRRGCRAGPRRRSPRPCPAAARSPHRNRRAAAAPRRAPRRELPPSPRPDAGVPRLRPRRAGPAASSRVRRPPPGRCAVRLRAVRR